MTTTSRRFTPGTFTDWVRQRITFEAAQAVTFSVLFDGREPGSFEGADRETARQIFGTLDEVPELARDVVCIRKGARVGGTRFSALRILHLGLTVSLDGLAPAEAAYGIFCGPDVRLSRQAFAFVVGEIESRPEIRRMVVGEIGKDSLTLRRPDRYLIRFECLPGTRGGSALRARTLFGVHFTEFAYVRDEAGAVNDVGLFTAVRPRVVRGGQVLIETTPWTATGLAYELDRDNWSCPTTVLAARCPTTLMRSNPRVHAMVAAERLRDPENAAREYDAEYLEAGASAFFDGPSLERAIVRDPGGEASFPASPTSGYGAGWDLGLIADSSAQIVGHMSSSRIFTVVDVLELRPKRGAPLKLSDVVYTFAGRLRPFHLREAICDGHSREPAREWADEHKLHIVSAPEGATGKSASYTRLQQALREGRVRLPDHGRLISQLRGVTSQPMPGGGLRLSSPRRAGQGHGDLVSALVLAYLAADMASSAYDQGAGSHTISPVLADLAGFCGGPFEGLHPGHHGFPAEIEAAVSAYSRQRAAELVTMLPGGRRS